ncbi:MAG: substrate-binding domain-containing protein [Christensenella sp.]|uniref:substrate-binding domain-containing protein n=1 Tax=Christensenella sp. TaxID=1935934 RepID=UPI002B1EF3B3|nr:substrate-binding domain-containing protein [Christensenella sp.]MEA5004660.1 substrate-binding domain-containing protein [Christensenella sp.]
MKKRGLKVVAMVLAVVFVMAAFAGCANQPAQGSQSAAPAASDAGTGDGASAPAASDAGTGDGAAAPVAGAGIKGSPDESYYLLVFSTGVEYWFPVYATFKEAGNQLGVKTEYVGSTEYDANKQVEVFNQILAKNPTGIYLSPITAEAFKAPVDEAVKQGVAVVTFASDSPDSARQGYVTSDNVKEGQHAARAFGEELGGKGKLMTLRNPGQTNHDIRVDTFIATIKEEYPGIELVADEPTNQDPDAAYTAVMTTAQKHPDLSGVFMPEASSAIGASRAAVELGGGDTKIKVMCCDVNAQILDMLKTGDVWGAINPDQGMQGYFGMLTLFTAAHPENVTPMNGKKEQGLNPTYIPMIDNGLNIVNKDNADYFYVDKYATSLGYSGVDDMLSPGNPNA